MWNLCLSLCFSFFFIFWFFFILFFLFRILIFRWRGFTSLPSLFPFYSSFFVSLVLNLILSLMFHFLFSSFQSDRLSLLKVIVPRFYSLKLVFWKCRITLYECLPFFITRTEINSFVFVINGTLLNKKVTWCQNNVDIKEFFPKHIHQHIC